jgi:protein involved in polysaccharide export with SLBB domain
MRSVFTVAALAIALLQAGAVTAQPAGVVAGKANTGDPAAAIGNPNSRGYTLGSADKVRITVYEEEALSGAYSVGADGDIAYPLVGPIKAAGQTPAQVGAAIAKLLSDGYVKDPKVSVEITAFRPYYILGEVAKPGEYPFSSDLTVMKAVAAAGGFSYRANHRKVFIKRADEDVEKAETLTPGAKIYPGDTIRIAERFF